MQRSLFICPLWFYYCRFTSFSSRCSASSTDYHLLCKCSAYQFTRKSLLKDQESLGHESTENQQKNNTSWCEHMADNSSLFTQTFPNCLSYLIISLKDGENPFFLLQKLKHEFTETHGCVLSLLWRHPNCVTPPVMLVSLIMTQYHSHRSRI